MITVRFTSPCQELYFKVYVNFLIKKLIVLHKVTSPWRILKNCIVYLFESFHVLHEQLKSKLEEFSDRLQTVLLKTVVFNRYSTIWDIL